MRETFAGIAFGFAFLAIISGSTFLTAVAVTLFVVSLVVKR